LAFEGFNPTVIGVFMKVATAVLLGAFVAFALTATGELVAVSLRDNGTRLPWFEAAVLFPVVALIVGS
jgi:hypothetical protein